MKTTWRLVASLSRQRTIVVGGFAPGTWGVEKRSGFWELGASVMGTSGAHYPTLTAPAIAWRTADYVTKNFGSLARRRT